MKIRSKQTLLRRGDGGRLYRIPGLVATRCGTLLCYFESRDPSGSDWSVSDIGLLRSTDGGATWSPMTVIGSGGGKNTSNNPVMIPDGDTVHLIYFENYKRAFYRRSDDEGVSWSAPREITDAFETVRTDYPWTVIAAGPGHGARLRSGRLLLPLWLGSNPASITAHHPSVTSTLYSDDGGESWQMGALLRDASVPDPNEAALAELSDGRVYLNLRNEAPRHERCFAVSCNGGASFGRLQFDGALPDPVCEGSLCAVPGGLCFANCASKTAREDLTLRLRRDGEEGWGESLLLEHLAGYSDLHYSQADGLLYVFYEHDSFRELRLASVSLE